MSKKRLLLARAGKTTPHILVEVKENYDPAKFKFVVVNGGWTGIVRDGVLTVDGDLDPSSKWPVDVLTDNQDRLRGDYSDVFSNYHNPNYIAPLEPIVLADDEDDDIPF